MHHTTDRMAHTTAFVTPIVEQCLEREMAQWVHYEGSIRIILRETTQMCQRKLIVLTRCFIASHYIRGLIKTF